MSPDNTEMMSPTHDQQRESVRRERRVTPPVDVFENENEILLLVDVPGAEREGLSVHLDGGQLDLEARQAQQAADALGFEPLVFARSFTVPNTVDASKVVAKIDRGVLSVHLPKSDAAKPRRIEVKSG
jgi:HSP20 family molecular chaperone IbpA